MKIVQSLDEIRNLNIGDKFYAVKHGQVYIYSFIGLNPKTNEPMGIDDANHSKIECFSASMGLNPKAKCFMLGTYNSTEIGQVMIDQLTDQIEAIRHIYLK